MRYMGWSWRDLQATPAWIVSRVIEEIRQENERTRREAAIRRHKK